MIRVTHNGVERMLDADGFENLREAVESWSGNVEGVPHLVMSMQINGTPASEEQLVDLESIPLADIQDLEVSTRASREVALSSLGHSAEYAESVSRVLLRTVDFYRTGHTVAANELCADLADSFSVLAAAWTSAARVLSPDADELGQFCQALRPWVEELVGAQMTEDWVRVADYLEFEIGPLIDEQAAALGVLRARLEPGEALTHGHA